jgi:hypothetical protein
MMTDLAMEGHAEATAMLLDARERYLKMGRACNYTFADVWLRDFSKQSVYYQFDATGEYVYLMMAYHKLSGGKDSEALAAAKAAAAKLGDRCMDLGWQVNMSAAGAVGCELLYKASSDTATWPTSRWPTRSCRRGCGSVIMEWGSTRPRFGRFVAARLPRARRNSRPIARVWHSGSIWSWRATICRPPLPRCCKTAGNADFEPSEK